MLLGMVYSPDGHSGNEEEFEVSSGSGVGSCSSSTVTSRPPSLFEVYDLVT